MKKQRWLWLCFMLPGVLAIGMWFMLSGCHKLENPSVPAGPTSPAENSGPNPSSSSTPAPSATNVVIDDPLTNGRSTGFVAGGQFIAGQGYKVTTNNGGYLQYETGVRNNIKIVFDAIGYISGEDDGTGKAIVVQVYDSPHNFAWTGSVSGPYSEMEFRKRGWCPTCADRVNGGEVKFVSNGVWSKEYRTWLGDSPAGHPLEWDANKTYHWEITIQSAHSQIIRNGQTIFDIAFAFNPNYNLNVRIGGVPYSLRAGPKNVTYSNVIISRL